MLSKKNGVFPLALALPQSALFLKNPHSSVSMLSDSRYWNHSSPSSYWYWSYPMPDLSVVPKWLGSFTHLKDLNLCHNHIIELPESLGQLTALDFLDVSDNQLTNLPSSLSNLSVLKMLFANKNPFQPELAAAEDKGIDALQEYLRSQGGVLPDYNGGKEEPVRRRRN